MGILSIILAFIAGAVFGVFVMCILQAKEHQKEIDNELWKRK